MQSLLLVGDPQQLPPTVRSREAVDLGMATSLFERLQAMGLKPLLLDTQYRCEGKRSVETGVLGMWSCGHGDVTL